MTQTQRKETEWVVRRAKLFEAGEYPDKGVSVSADTLAALEHSFADPVPVLIEHAQSPLEIGFLTEVRAVGPELFGTLSLTPEADALLARSGARSLSVGLAADLSRIEEVSLVRQPRVATARLFTGEVLNDARAWQERYESLRAAQRTEEAEREAQEWVAKGRLTPSQVPFAKALLMQEESIVFDGTRQPLRSLLIAILERQPPHALFTRTAPVRPALDEGDHLLLPEEADFYRRHFPDVNLTEIARSRGRARS